MAIVIGISGRINSGKTAFSNELSQRLTCNVVSFGDYVRKIASIKGILHERTSLQKLGQELVENDLENFCKNVIYQNNWDRESILIIEGIRHSVVLEKLKEIIFPLKLFLIYVDTPELKLIERDQAEDTLIDRASIERHQTEREVSSFLKSKADLIIEMTDNVSEICKLVLQKIQTL